MQSDEKRRAAFGVFVPKSKTLCWTAWTVTSMLCFNLSVLGWVNAPCIKQNVAAQAGVKRAQNWLYTRCFRWTTMMSGVYCSVGCGNLHDNLQVWRLKHVWGCQEYRVLMSDSNSHCGKCSLHPSAFFTPVFMKVQYKFLEMYGKLQHNWALSR